MTNSESNFVRIIREICEEEQISLQSYSFDWIFELQKHGKVRYILGYQFGLNTASVNSICCDKAAASEIMTAHGIPNIEHRLFASPGEQKFVGKTGCWSSLIRFLEEKGTLVIKPNDGTGGDRVFKVSSAYELETAVHTIYERSGYISASPFYDIENEYRTIMLDGDARLVYVKRRPHLTGDGVSTVAELIVRHLTEQESISTSDVTIPGRADRIPAKGEQILLGWKHNLGLGARAELLEDGPLKKDIETIVAEVARCLGVRFASIDIAETGEGLKVLEINSGVMMENFAGQDAKSREIAKSIYRDAIRLMFE
jgi:glutathione synthase/RimK-type ligase-like ATP-grasp enzyme